MDEQMTFKERKNRYHSFLAENDHLPVYIEDWYLDLVCGAANWDVCLVIKNRRVDAVLPYFIKKNKMFRWIGMPGLSKLHGPYFSKDSKQDNQYSLVKQLLDQLPEIDFYQQSLGYGFTNWLPYLWEGYSQVTLYSYVFETLDTDLIFKNMDPDNRRRIRNGQQTLGVGAHLDFDVFFDLLAQTYIRQKLPVPFKKEFLAAYCAELKARGRGRIMYVCDEAGIALSACLLIWDKQGAYYLLEGTSMDSRDKNASILLKWEAIKYVKEHLGLDRFDFEGSISKRIENVYRKFGATPVPYFVIKKYFSKLFLCLKFLQNYRQYGKLVQW